MVEMIYLATGAKVKVPKDRVERYLSSGFVKPAKKRAKAPKKTNG